MLRFAWIIKFRVQLSVMMRCFPSKRKWDWQERERRTEGILCVIKQGQFVYAFWVVRMTSDLLKITHSACLHSVTCHFFGYYSPVFCSFYHVLSLCISFSKKFGIFIKREIINSRVYKPLRVTQTSFQDSFCNRILASKKAISDYSVLIRTQHGATIFGKTRSDKMTVVSILCI